jgi:hypothetical protein
MDVVTCLQDLPSVCLQQPDPEQVAQASVVLVEKRVFPRVLAATQGVRLQQVLQTLVPVAVVAQVLVQPEALD